MITAPRLYAVTDAIEIEHPSINTCEAVAITALRATDEYDATELKAEIEEVQRAERERIIIMLSEQLEALSNSRHVSEDRIEGFEYAIDLIEQDS